MIQAPQRIGRALLGIALFGAALNAQTLRVLADSTAPVPFALVSVNGATERVANAKGELSLAIPAERAIALRVRRLGYREFQGAPSRDSLGLYVRLVPLALQLAENVTTAREDTPLARRGFYDRMERVQRGAILGEFITPEQLDDRPASNTSDYLRGRRYVRVERTLKGGRNVPLLTGRGGCGMTLIVDGQRVAGMVEENTLGDAATSINSAGTQQKQSDNTLDVDQAVAGRSIMAIEIYPSTANAPVELQSLGGRGSCGIVAIWTGPRR